jgi:hypothetical protein
VCRTTSQKRDPVLRARVVDVEPLNSFGNDINDHVRTRLYVQYRYLKDIYKFVQCAWRHMAKIIIMQTACQILSLLERPAN